MWMYNTFNPPVIIILSKNSKNCTSNLNPKSLLIQSVHHKVLTPFTLNFLRDFKSDFKVFYGISIKKMVFSAEIISVISVLTLIGIITKFRPFIICPDSILPYMIRPWSSPVNNWDSQNNF